MSSEGTLAAQILMRAKVAEGPPGSAYFFAEPGLLLGHEATVALLIERFEKAGLRVKYPERCLFAADHFVPPATAERAAILRKYLDFLERQRLPREHLFHGISHQLMLEDRRVVPGMFISGADSHTTLAGALGCAAAGFGSTDMLAAFALGRVHVRVPASVKLRLTGALRDEARVGSRDLALAMMGLYRQGGLAYRALEMHDETERGVPLDMRASVCNQAVDAGAKFGMFVPDEAMLATLRARDGEGVHESVEQYVRPRHDAVYERVDVIDVGGLVPLLARPGDPSDVAAVAEAGGEPIAQAFIGSCAGGRIDDIREAAEVLKGRKVATGVRLVVTPASRAVWLEAAERGYLATLVAAGAMVTDSSCGACGGIDKGLLAAGEACVSTSNRNFRGRMGDPEARIYLASARTAAASALTGRVTCPREVMA